MNLAQSATKIFFARLGKSLIGFLAVIVFSRELGASPLGIYYPFVALLGILSIPADLGIKSATEKRVSEGKNSSAYVATAISIKTPIILIISAIIILGSGYVNRYLGASLAIPLVVGLIINQFGQLSLSILRGELRVGETAIAEILQPLSWLAVGYILYLEGFGVHGLVYGYIFGGVLILIYGSLKISTNIGIPTIDHARSLFEYGKYSVVSSVGGYVYSWLDIIILTFFVMDNGLVTRSSIGAYENAWRLTLFALIIGRAIGTTVFPQFSRWDAEDARERIEKVIPTAALLSLAVVIPAFVGTAILSKELLSTLFGPEFTVAWIALTILSAEKILQSIHGVIARPLQAIDRPDLAAYATAVAIVVNIVLNIVLISQFGIVGAAIATTVSFAVNTILHARFLSRFLNIYFPFREISWIVLSSGAMGVIIYLVHSVVDIRSIVELTVIVLIGIISYSAMVLIYRPIRMKLGKITESVLSKRIV
ncbi:flippase [Salinigranum sp. GCM10025319]|uniref:flippase n=1 Tax=Salinigranum sp. GCM10025319 TaxID=3252687 RepID=UPI003609DDCB